MPKVEKWSSKWIGNKMKGKGLMKLRWYCQMCEKQCRDENGFKCHRTSDQHQQQMAVFCQNPGKFMDEFSSDFEKGYMRLMSTTYCKTRVLANHVYMEFIKDRHHMHMNSTIWVTLSGFVQYLGRTNQCKVEKTQKGWYVEYIDNSPEAKKREEESQKRVKADLTDEERQKQLMDQLIKEGKERGGYKESECTALERTSDGPLSLNLNIKNEKKTVPKSVGNVFEVEDAKSALKRGSDELNGEESSKQKMKTNEEDNWVVAGIVVKVMNKKVGDGAFYKKKGEIMKVRDKYTADVKMHDSGKTLRLDQDDLETVIPGEGKPVFVVKGENKGQQGLLVDILVDEFKVIIELEEDIVQLGYEEISKLA